MNQVTRKFRVVEGGSPNASGNHIGELIGEPLTNPEYWLDAIALSGLAGVSERAGQKAIKARKWRGVHLEVREVEIGRGGASGRALQVHVKSLPLDLQRKWYSEHNINVHEKPDPITGETILVAADGFTRDQEHERNLAVARWRHDVIRPALAHPRHSRERRAELDKAASTARLYPERQNQNLDPAHVGILAPQI